VREEIPMNYDEYIQKVGFRLYGPGSRLKGFGRLTNLGRRFNVPLEIVNTRLPEGGREMQRRLGALCAIPRMSTFAIGAIINRTVSSMRQDVQFVNVGVWHGFTLLSGMRGNADKQCIGIDNFSQYGGPKEQFLRRFSEEKSPNHRFYDMDYREYFAGVHSGEIGFYIYDGDHNYEHQMLGLKVAEPFFAKNCIILVDDTNGVDPRQATLDFMRQKRNKYELLLDAATDSNCHPTYWNGIMIWRKC
jgi:Methyltransferase domain